MSSSELHSRKLYVFNPFDIKNTQHELHRNYFKIENTQFNRYNILLVQALTISHVIKG